MGIVTASAPTSGSIASSCLVAVHPEHMSPVGVG